MTDHQQLPPIQSPPTHVPQFSPAPLARKGTNWWVLGTILGFVGLLVFGVFGFLMYIGLTSPSTAVYEGNDVPENYLDRARELGALDEDETVLFFYSDGFTNIDSGFYFVSNKHVVIYGKDLEPPLSKIRFAEIKSTKLERNESVFEDSLLTIYLRDGDVAWFPVSSEFERDKKFHAAIKQRIDK